MKRIIKRFLFIILCLFTCVGIFYNVKFINNINQFIVDLDFDSYKINYIFNENKDILEENVQLNNEIKDRKFNSCNIYLGLDGFYIKDSLVKINGESPLFVELSESNQIEYDSNNNYFLLNDFYIFKNLKNNSNLTTNIGVFSDSKNINKYVIGQKSINQDILLSINKLINDDEEIEYSYNFIKNVFKSSYDSSLVKDFKLKINDLTISPDWSNNVVITKDFITLGKGNDTIYISKYDKKLDGAGFKEKIDINGKVFLYGNYLNEDSDVMPYILEDNYNILILVPKDVEIKEIFN